jgi:hypothetical protein
MFLVQQQATIIIWCTINHLIGRFSSSTQNKFGKLMSIDKKAGKNKYMSSHTCPQNTEIPFNIKAKSEKYSKMTPKLLVLL